MAFYSEQFAGKEFKSIRVVHTNVLWQENESGWCEIEVFDHDTDTLIASGRDIISFSGKPFSMEANMNVKGMVCYGAKFKMPDAMYHNELSIEVI